jgi:hypothetical protein
MGINKVQFQKGLSMTKFMERYGTEERCHAALVKSRWPTDFVCPGCGSSRHCTCIRRVTKTDYLAHILNVRQMSGAYGIPPGNLRSEQYEKLTPSHTQA